MNARTHLEWAPELLSGRSIFERFEFIQSALHFQQFSICKAAASAWDGCFGGTRRIERGDWDWSSHLGFQPGKAVITIHRPDGNLGSEHHGHSLGSCGFGARIRWAYWVGRSIVALPMDNCCYYGQGASTDKLDLSIMVAAWDSCCYGTRIEQVGSDIFEEK